MNKLHCKWLWRGLGLPIPEFIVIEAERELESVIKTLGLPLFVKPNGEGSSLGVSKVHSLEEMQEAYTKAASYDREVIAERFIDGGEYTVGILDGRPLSSIRIETPRMFYDYAAKYLVDTTQFFCESGLPADQEQALQQLALRAYHALGCRHWGRVDFMRDSQGNFYLLEVNTIPGLTEHSLVPQAARQIGIEFDKLIEMILAQTLQ